MINVYAGDMSDSMNILLTGGSGFIGRNILESFLARKYTIVAPSHNELDLIDEERVRSFFLQNEIDVVIHAGAKPGHRNAKDPSNIFHANSRMFFNIMRNADHFRKVIVIGSGAVYDMRYYQPKMKEEYFDEHVPVDEHGYNKYVCGKFIELIDNMVDLRVFGIFGKYEDYAIRFISNLICKAIFDLPLTMKQNRKFDYLYIDDLMPVLDHFIQNETRYKEYNVTPDESVELYAIAQRIRDLSGKDLPIVVSQEGMGSEYSGDNSRLREEMPELRFTPLDEAIKKLYAWYSDNKTLINRELLLRDK